MNEILKNWYEEQISETRLAFRQVIFGIVNI